MDGWIDDLKKGGTSFMALFAERVWKHVPETTTEQTIFVAQLLPAVQFMRWCHRASDAVAARAIIHACNNGPQDTEHHHPPIYTTTYFHHKIPLTLE